MKTGTSFIANFFEFESAGGVLFMFAAVLAAIWANTPLRGMYTLLFDMPVEIGVGPIATAKPLLLWINDGLMAVFFF